MAKRTIVNTAVVVYSDSVGTESRAEVTVTTAVADKLRLVESEPHRDRAASNQR